MTGRAGGVHPLTCRLAPPSVTSCHMVATQPPEFLRELNTHVTGPVFKWECFTALRGLRGNEAP